MGMDVYGKNPKSKTGEYFRNNVWWWRRLWDYCCEIGNGIINDDLKSMGHFNDGAGLDEAGSLELAKRLQEKIDNGETKKTENEYNAFIEALPDEKCTFCNGTGKRRDKVGAADIAWQEKCGGCNACGGKGTVRPNVAVYPFAVENVQEFADFLKDCGGFEIC